MPLYGEHASILEVMRRETDWQELIVVETYEDEPSSFLSGKAAWNSNMKVISRSDLAVMRTSFALCLFARHHGNWSSGFFQGLQRLPGDDLSIGVKRRKSCESFGNAEDCDV